MLHVRRESTAAAANAAWGNTGISELEARNAATPEMPLQEWAGGERKRLLAASEPELTEPAACLITKIHVGRFRDVLAIVAAFRRMRKRAAGVPQLLETFLVFSSPRTVLLLSLWTSEEGFAQFATAVPEHAARVAATRRSGAQIWSALFELVGATQTSGQWSMRDLEAKQKAGR